MIWSYVYVVYWPELECLKVGMGQWPRVRYWENRGASTLRLLRCHAPLDAEHAARSAVTQYPPRWGSKAEMAAATSSSGGGYRECVTVPATAVSAALEAIDQAWGCNARCTARCIASGMPSAMQVSMPDAMQSTSRAVREQIQHHLALNLTFCSTRPVPDATRGRNLE